MSAQLRAQKEEEEHGQWTLSLPPALNSVLAGYAGGVSAVLVGHPMDSIKVLLQTKGGRANMSGAAPTAATTTTTTTTVATAPTATAMVSAQPPPAVGSVKHLSTAAAASRLPANAQGVTTSRSLLSLYAGVSPQLVTFGLIGSANFALYDGIRQGLHQCRGEATSTTWRDEDSLWHVSAASLVAGTLVGIPTNPINVIRTQQQVNVWNFQTAVADTWRRTSSSSSRTLRPFFVGMAPHLVCDGVGRMISLTTYECLKRKCLAWKHPEEQSRGILLSERVMCAAVGGVACWSVIYPFDVVRCRMYAAAPSPNMPAWKLAQFIHQTEGWTALYRGLGVTVARAAVTAAVMLPVYDVTLEWLMSQTK